MTKPISLDLIPEVLLWLIFGKLNAVAYIRLFQSCKNVANFLESRKRLVSLEAKLVTTNDIGSNFQVINSINDVSSIKNELDFFRITAQIYEIRCNDSFSNFCELELVRDLKFKCLSLRISGTPTSSKEDILRFIEIIRPEAITIRSEIPKEQFPPSLFNRLKMVDLWHSNYNNSELLQFSSENIRIRAPGVDSIGVNILLKQWYKKEREIEIIRLSGTMELVPETVVADLPVNLLYDGESHKDSIIYHRYTTMPNFVRDQAFYILWRADRIHETLVLNVRKNYASIEPCNDPVEYLFQRFR